MGGSETQLRSRIWRPLLFDLQMLEFLILCHHPITCELSGIYILRFGSFDYGLVVSF